MNDLDHMLDGKGSHDHLQNMIQQAQLAKFAREVKPKRSNKSISLVRAVFAAIINLVMR